MKEMTKHFKFWGEACAELVGISAAGALVLLIFMDVLSSDSIHSGRDLLIEIFSLYPYYFLLTGGFILLIFFAGSIKANFSLLLSLNATRRSIVWGIMISGFVLAIIMTLIAYGCWVLTPGDIAADGLELLPFISSLFLVAAGVFVVFAVLSIRWGKLAILLFIVCGGAFGFGGMLLLTGGVIDRLPELSARVNSRFALVVGLLVYFASGCMVRLMTRRIEVTT